MPDTVNTPGAVLKFSCPNGPQTAEVTLGDTGLTVDMVPVCKDCNTAMVLDTVKRKDPLSADDEKAIQDAIDAYRQENPHSRMVR